MSLPNTIVIDLDGTLTVDNKSVPYENKSENRAIVSAVKQAKAQGYQVTIATSRNMRTFCGDIEKIKQHTQPIIETWLAEKAIPYDNLIVGKPWCGPMGFYVDDKNIHLEEFIFRFSSGFAEQKIDVVKILPPHLSSPPSSDDFFRLSRLFDVAQLVYVTASETRLSAADIPIQQYQDSEIIAALSTYLQQCEADYLLFESLPGEMSLFKLLYPHLEQLSRLRHDQGFRMRFFKASEQNCTSVDEFFFYGISKAGLLSCIEGVRNLSELVINLDKMTQNICFPHVLVG